MLLIVAGRRRLSELRRRGPFVISATMIAFAVFIQMISCTKDDFRRSFTRNQWLHHEYVVRPPKLTVRSLKINFSAEIVEAAEGDSILNPQFANPDYQQAVQEYMEEELRGAGLMESSKREGDVLNCRFTRVSAWHIPERSFLVRKTAGEVALDCFLEDSGWRYSGIGRGKTRGQGAQSIWYSANVAIDGATQKLIVALAEQLGASGP